MEKRTKSEKRARKDNMNHLEERSEEAEKADARGDLDTSQQIHKRMWATKTTSTS